MKAFVTGGSGFIGKHVVLKLLTRGYDVHALARSPQSAAGLHAAGATIVTGDILDTASMRDAMAGSDLVFHVAGWYEIGSRHPELAEQINVTGTRKVLRLAHELGVPRIIYVSTVAVFGDTKGQLVNEEYYNDGPFATEYDRTKWLAHYKVALPLIEQGAPIIIVQPGGVYGPGDHSLAGELMRWFYRGRLPILPGADFIFTYAHVEDIAEGIILAAEKGRIGQSYVLAGPAVPLGEMVDFYAQITGKRAPLLRIPSALVVPFAPLMGRLESVVPLPLLFSRESIVILPMSYMASAEKARTELGWQPRPLQTGMAETFQWIAQEVAAEPPQAIATRRRQLGYAALGLAMALLLLWLLGRRKQNPQINTDEHR